MTVELLTKADEQAWDAYLIECPTTLLYSGMKYRELLRLFTGTEPFYFVAKDEGGRIRGVLPSFLMRNAAHGPVLNSLPFYGSNGAVFDHANDPAVRAALLHAFNSLAEQTGCVSSTLITSPFEKDVSFYERETWFTFRDSRIGQVSSLPPKGENSDADLMACYHSKTRNLVRKAQQMGFEVAFEPASEVMPFVVETHQENLSAIGGRCKPAAFFDLIPQLFEEGRDFGIITARHEGRLVAGLLLFYFNRTVEYFTPVIVEEHRPRQPLSLLIHEAMKDAVGKGFAYWNWGGTWRTQDGVYHFKSRWGAKDLPYHYFTRILDQRILSVDSKTLLAQYPNYFVAPFDQLKS